MRTYRVCARQKIQALQRLAVQADREILHSNRSLQKHLAQMQVVGRYLGDLLDSMDIGVVAVDNDTRITMMNRAAEAMVGTEQANARGRPYHTLPCEMTPPPPLAEALETNATPPSRRSFVRRPDGGRLLVESSIHLVRDARGRVIGAAHVLKDLSPIAELEKRIEQADRLAAIGKIAACLAHEIRNPLAAIEGFSRLLVSDLDENDARRKFAENIVLALEDLNRALNSTLIFARQPRLNLALIDPLELLDCVKEFVEQEIAAKHLDGTQVVVAPPRTGSPALPSVLVDAEQIKRALLNLAKNSLDAMPEGGRLTLRASAAPEHFADKPASAGKPMVRLSVVDTGPGIVDEIRDRLFEPFETTKQHGNGLGLAIVKKVVEVHGGKVTAENISSAGESISGRTSSIMGAAFHLDLPTCPMSGDHTGLTVREAPHRINQQPTKEVPWAGNTC